MTRYREIYRADQLPVIQNRMFHSEKEARDCIKGDVILIQDLETGLIFNQAFRPELMRYDECYQNEQAGSPFFQNHLSEVSKIIVKNFQNRSLVEIGCGKGYFIEQLLALGFKIIGFDPIYEGINPCIVKEYFSPSVGLRADGIILRHVLEHVQDPVKFIMNICACNGRTGKIYIEVPCFDWICRQSAWFDIFYEHVNYFRMSDFGRIFGQIFEMGHLFGGQYLYVVADLASVKFPVYNLLDSIDFPKDFLDSIHGYVNRIRSQVTGHGSQNYSAIWGGASKGVIFALFMQRAGAGVDIVVDINPAKQGKYLPATGLQVISPASALQRLAPGADIFVMNSNYLSEIQDLTINQFNYHLVDHELV